MSASETPVSATRCCSRRSSSSASFQPCEPLASSSDGELAARSDSGPVAPSSAPGPPSMTVSAAVTGSDEVGLDERAVDAQRDAVDVAELDEVLGLCVVHDDRGRGSAA